MSLPAVNFNDPGVKHALTSFLKNHLKMEVKTGGSFDPNTRTIVLSLDDEEICQADFGVKQKAEYRG